MKRLLIVCLVGLLVAGAFAAGKEAEKKKFPYLSDSLNTEVSMTKAEWECRLSGFRTAERIMLNRFTFITELGARLTDNHILLRASGYQVRQADKQRFEEAANASCQTLGEQWLKRHKGFSGAPLLVELRYQGETIGSAKLGHWRDKELPNKPQKP